jgi:ligand-binding sensor domain-containing protein
MYRILSVVLFFCLLIRQNVAYSQVFSYKEYNTSNGFINDYIYDVEQDSMGYIWLATAEGIVKYNNKLAVNYKFKKSSNNLYFDVSIDQNGVWVCGKNGLFGTIIDDNVHPFDIGVSSKIVKVLSVGRGLVCALSQDGVAVIFDVVAKKVIKKELLGKNEVSYVKNAIFRDGKLYLCDANGIFVFAFSSTREMQLIQHVTDVQNVNDLVWYRDKFYACTDNDGVLTFSLKNGRLAGKTPLESANQYINTPVKSIVFDVHGDAWISTFGQGVLEIEKINSSLKPNVNFHNKGSGFAIEFVNKCIEDYQGNVWFATYGAGLISTTNDFVKLIAFNNHKDDVVNDVSSHNNVVTVAVKNKVYTLIEQDSTQLLFSIPSSFGDITHLASNTKSIFVATTVAGVLEYQLKSKKLVSVPYFNESLAKKVNHIMLEDNLLWISTYNGLFIYDISQKKNVVVFNTSSGLRHNLVNVVCKMNNGLVAVGTKSNRLFFVSEDLSISEVQLPSANPKISISDIKEVGDRLYIGTLGSGLYVKTKDNIVHYSKEDGLVSNYINGIQPYNDKFLFVIHEDNLSVLSIKNGKIMRFDKSFGYARRI